MELLRQALTELAAAKERPYLDDDADREAAAGYYADLDLDADAPALYSALSSLLEDTHRVRPSYSPADELYPWVDLQPDGMLRSIYTEEEFDPKTVIEEAAEIAEQRASFRAATTGERVAVDASAEAEVEELHPYNCEHVVCQSWFTHAEPMRGDLHHLFTCERKCNSFRGSSPYTNFADYLEVVRESCGKREASGFEPWRAKGPVARATLYFLIRYPRLGVYSEETLALLLEWHGDEPVSDYERHRNAAIFEKQGNRNPVIDHPDWAARIAFADGL
jgi:endonuclease G, mitochondrial